MKKVLFYLIIILLSIAAFNSYVQAQGMGALSVQPYHSTVLQEDKNLSQFSSDFLEQINTEKNIYQVNPSEKIGYGVMNAATSWTDIPRKVGEMTQEHNILLGCTIGLGQGVFTGLARGVSGAVETATFGIPPYDKPFMKPEYTVDRPEEGFKVKLIKW